MQLSGEAELRDSVASEIPQVAWTQDPRVFRSVLVSEVSSWDQVSERNLDISGRISKPGD